MEHLEDPLVQDLISRVELGRDKNADDIFAKERHIPSTVTITLKTGRVLRNVRRWPSGDPEDPLSVDEIKTKFREITAPIKPSDKADRIISDVMKLERIDSMPKAVAGW